MESRGWLLGVLLLGCACRPAAESPATLYLRASADLRRGQLAEAATLAALIVSSKTEASPELLASARLLRAEVALAGGRSTEAAQDAQTELPSALQRTAVAARRDKVLAQIDLTSGRLDMAATRLQRAEQLARTLNDSHLLVEILLVDGTRLRLQRDSAAAARTEEGYRAAVSANDGYWQAAALNNLGILHLRSFDYDGALGFFERALEAAHRVDARRFAAVSLTNISLCAYRLGDLERSGNGLRDAARVQESIGAWGDLQASLGELGNLYILRGQPADAMKAYRRAIELARVHAPTEAARWESNLATALANAGEWSEAQRLNEQAATERQAAGDAVGLAYARLNAGIIAAGLDRLDDAERLLLDARERGGNNPDLQWEANAELGAVYARKGDRSRAAAEFERALSGVEATRAALQRDHQITFLVPRIRFYQRYVEFLIDYGDPNRALEVVESSRVQLLASRFGRAPWEQRRASIATLQQLAAREQSALISYWITSDRSLAWVITARDVRLITLPPEARLRPLVRAYRRYLESSASDPLSVGFAPAEALYDLVVAPLNLAQSGLSRAIIAPDGPLTGLPFDALIVRGPRPHYWVEDVSLRVAPSLTALTMANATSPTRGGTLAIGAPEPVVGDLPPLPNAPGELASIALRVPARVIRGKEATPDAFLNADPTSFARVHFATHTIANAASPLDSAIVLAPGAHGPRLLARELLDRRLQAELVTISACRSAGARDYSGEGLVGFAWVFLHAGARHVVAGLWDVNDRSTAQLMDAFYAALARGESSPDALRSAKRRLLDSGTAFRKPYYWAPFQIFEGPGPGPAPASGHTTMKR
jgi:CHAT domain-containing protein/Tfp pilus assembly protein PilF